MILGSVNARLEPIVRLQVKDAAGVDHDVDAVIDSGFTGFLTLPTQLVAQLGLPWLRRARGILAFNRLTWIAYHDAIIVWNGRHQSIEIAAGGADPLIGTELLEGYQVWIEFIRSGNVQIVPLP